MQREIQFILWASFFFTSGQSLEKFICQGNTETKTCDDSKIIKVEKAYYGRMSRGRCWEPIILNTNCLSGEDEIRKLCDGKTFCELTASSEFFGNDPTWNDPCPRTSKYVYMEYTCQAPDDITESTSGVTNSTATDVTNITTTSYTTGTSTNVTAVATTGTSDNKQTTRFSSTIQTSTDKETTTSSTVNGTATSYTEKETTTSSTVNSTATSYTENETTTSSNANEATTSFTVNGTATSYTENEATTSSTVNETTTSYTENETTTSSNANEATTSFTVNGTATSSTENETTTSSNANEATTSSTVNEATIGDQTTSAFYQTMTSGEKQSTPDNVAMIVGISVSVVVLVILMIIMLIWCIRSKEYQKMAANTKCLSKNKVETLDSHNSLSHQKHSAAMFIRSGNNQPNEYSDVTREQEMNRKLSKRDSSKDSYTSTKIDEVLNDVDSNNQYATIGVVETRTSSKLGQDGSMVSAQTVKDEFVRDQSEITNSDKNSQILYPPKENKLDVDNILYGVVNDSFKPESSDGSERRVTNDQYATVKFKNGRKSKVSLQTKLDVENILYGTLNSDNDVSSGRSDVEKLVVENILYSSVENSTNDQTDSTNSQQLVDNVLYELDGCDQVSIEASRINEQSRVEKHEETEEDSKSDIEFYEEVQTNKEDDDSDEAVQYAEIDVDLKREHSASETMIDPLYDSIQTNIDEAAEVKVNILYDPDG